MTDSAGLHIIMDARVQDASVFTANNLKSLFEEIVAELGMKPLDEVKVYEVDVDPEILKRVQQTGQFEDEGGISCIQVISTSHLTIHAWPLQKYFAMDAFSCKMYDDEAALRIVRDRLNIVAENTLLVHRRKPYPTSKVSQVQRFFVLDPRNPGA